MADKAWRGVTATALPSPPASALPAAAFARAGNCRQKQSVFPHMHFPASAKYLTRPSLLRAQITQGVVRQGFETSLLSSLLPWQGNF